MLATTNRLLNLTFCVIVVAYQMIYFFFFFSVHVCKQKRGGKKKERRCLSLPNMKHQLFISQACHINKGSILGLGAKMGDNYVPILPPDARVSSVSSALLLMQYYTI